MQLTILGSGTGIATKNRNAPGYLINVGNKLILLDAGEGTKRQIIKAGFDLFSLTHIFITHTHVDHVAEIPAIVWPFHFTRVKSVLNFFGPPRFKKFFGTAFKAFIPNINQRKKLKIKIRELKNNKIKLDDITIETRLMTEKMGSTFL